MKGEWLVTDYHLTLRGGVVRVISLRRANVKEMKRYV
jgi:uncharacterized DUF497 family protein